MSRSLVAGGVRLQVSLLAPVVGGLLGVTPGCGGAIMVMPLYTRGVVSFGTVVATLVATLGDSAFVLLAAAPRIAVFVHVVALVAGTAVGYAVDALGLQPYARDATAPTLWSPAASTVGAAAAETDLTGRRLAYRFPSPAILGSGGSWPSVRVFSVLVVFRLGILGVVIGTLVGLIPGCGPQIVFVGLREVLESHRDARSRVVEGLTFAVRYAQGHALFQRLLRVEPGVVLPRLTTEASRILDAAIEVLEPYLVEARKEGQIRRIDPRLGAEWIARTGISLILTPSPSFDADDQGQLRALLEDMFRAALSTG